MFSIFFQICPSFVPRLSLVFYLRYFVPHFFYFYVIFSYVVKQLFDDSYVKCFG